MGERFKEDPCGCACGCSGWTYSDCLRCSMCHLDNPDGCAVQGVGLTSDGREKATRLAAEIRARRADDEGQAASWELLGVVYD